jgi:hypothetical protein
MKHKGREEYYLGEWADGIKKGQGLAYRQGEYLYYGSFGEASKDSGSKALQVAAYRGGVIQRRKA